MLPELQIRPGKNGLLPTPPAPADLPKVELTENARQVLVRRYVRRSPDGTPGETIEEMFWRVAYHVAACETAWHEEVLPRARQFYDLLTSKRFFPNSPTFTGAGTPLGQLAACFVLPITDDMGRREDGIFQTLRNAALIQQTGGGNGFSFSRLRPEGSLVKSSAGKATGPIGFLRVYDKAFGEVAQGGSRRGANMAVLRVDHPDIEEFITCKIDENAITNFNISVGITDAFMEAVRNDEDWELRFPDVGSAEYKDFFGTLEQAEAADVPLRAYKKVRARELFAKIVRQAHHNGEPGVLFLDAANRSNPVPHLYPLESTNPCFTGDTRLATRQGFLTLAELQAAGSAVEIATDRRAGEQPSTGTACFPAGPVYLTRRQAAVRELVTRHGYRVTATPDHRFLTPERGYVTLGDLRPGDRVLLQSGEGVWSQETALPNAAYVQNRRAEMALSGDRASGATVQRQDFAAQYEHVPTEWSQELGLALGWLVGDGWLSPASNAPVGLVFGSNGSCPGEEALHPILRRWFGEGHLHDRGSVKQLTYGRLPYEFFSSLGVLAVPSPEKRVPESLWRAPRPAVVGFLQGLFSADGSVQWNVAKQDCTIRLASSSKQLLEEVQLLLINFGIVTRLYKRRNSMRRPMPDGKGGQQEYSSRPQFELVIGKANRERFAELIGFADAHKQAVLENFLQHPRRRGAYRETFTDEVVAIHDAGMADVYDLTEPATHSLIANGLVAHNCGEQWLGPFENCCLGSVNLAQHLGENGQVDWEKLRQSVVLATIFLDDVVEANAYVPSVPQLKVAAHRARRIGLGIMGLADLMYHAGIRYGSAEGQEFSAQVMEFVRYHAMQTSIHLAEQRGAFPAIEGSIYDPENLTWQPPQALESYTQDWGRPAIDWEAVVAGIRQHGIRNAAQTTVAPTGTIATVAGCEGYGCEPVFALAYIRHVNDNGRDLQLTYTSPAFEAALVAAGLNESTRQQVVEHVLEHGSCQELEELPAEIRHTFVVSQDISAEEHVRMQAALQAFVDNSMSKTVNFPADASEDEVATAYQLAWELGCKGITVYVTGSRQKVVLETKATAQQKQAGAPDKTEAPAAEAETAQLNLWHDAKKPRPRSLRGFTYTVSTPLGKAFITINENGGNQPFEVFINTAKAGSDTAAVSEAIGRLVSYILRLASPVAPRERLREVWRQLAGIGGGRSLGFGPNRVRSLPDGVAQVLGEYLDNVETGQAVSQMEMSFTPSGEAPATSESAYSPLPTREQPILKFGDLCPECGQAAVINEEGCRKCYSCGFSEC